MDSDEDQHQLLGALLRIRRCAVGLTQEELAERSGVSVRTIRNIERGRTVAPSRTSVRLLAAALSEGDVRAWEMPVDLNGTESASKAGAAWALTLLAQTVRPAQLPPAQRDLCGREQEVTKLAADLAGDDRAVTAAAVVGMAGMGKTALALTVAHRVIASFPGGQLYVNLHGTTTPAAPGQVLARILRDLGVPISEIPADADELAGRYQSLLTGRRILLMLDDARDSRQVRPLIPGSAGCGVIITSRRQLADLDCCRPLTLGPLSPAAARELVASTVGQERLVHEPAATEQLLSACGGLPLALKIAALRLSSRPAWSVQSLAQRLADPDRRLAELSLGELEVAAAIRRSYDSLTAFDYGVEAQGVFGILGQIGMARFGADHAAALAGRPRKHMERILELLVDTHLLAAPAPGRYQFHELVSGFAKQLGAESEECRSAAGTLPVP
jgi:transcriptional regulator with XRE-family HTH domain